MSDNSGLCGAECVDGTPCQHPADECPVPSHNGAVPDGGKNPQGRPFAITEADHDTLIEAAGRGASKSGCARAVGVDKASLLRYLEDHPDFRTEFRRARFEGESRLITKPLDDPEGMDTQHARFLLSTSYDYEKTEKRELEHSGEGIVIHTDAED